MSRRRRGRSRPYCIVLTGSSTEVEQERDLTITGTTSLDRAFSQSPSAEHSSMPANLHGRYGGVKNSEWSLPLGQQLPRRPSLDERHTRTLGARPRLVEPSSDTGTKLARSTHDFKNFAQVGRGTKDGRPNISRSSREARPYSATVARFSKTKNGRDSWDVRPIIGRLSAV
ncbi:hypothetical protein Bbelb_254110 [Branchiostoma belcheri]|nr:hypothetical protein Bbelb_254110 [Branchiostoma belcheri]